LAAAYDDWVNNYEFKCTFFGLFKKNSLDSMGLLYFHNKIMTNFADILFGRLKSLV